MSGKIVKEYYARTVAQEWRRLARDAYHRLEFDTTMRFIRKYFPKRGLVLDAGGGPGRYTIELAKAGYDVILHDLTPENLSFARNKIRRAGLARRVKALDAGSITDLRIYQDNSFDAVICLGGPRSHVLEPKRIDRAGSELIRVVKKGAPIIVSVMSRLAVLRTTNVQECQGYRTLPGRVGVHGLPFFPAGRIPGIFHG